jgi:hypothetical protein
MGGRKFWVFQFLLKYGIDYPALAGPLGDAATRSEILPPLQPFFDVELIAAMAKMFGKRTMDVTRFNRHLLRSKLNWSDSHEESEIPSRIQG